MFKKKKTNTSGNQHIMTMLPRTDPSFFDNWRIDTIAFSGDDTKGLDDLSKALPGGAEQDFSSPDVFMPAIRLESHMSGSLFNRQRAAANGIGIAQVKVDYNAVIRSEEIKRWLRVLITVLCSDGNSVYPIQLDLGEDASKPLLLRVLYKSLLDSGCQNPSLTLFMHRTNDGQAEPIAFTYPGIKTGLCPAENIDTANLLNGGGWLGVQDPIERLHAAGNEGYRKSLYQFFSFNNDNTHVLFPAKLRDVITCLRNEIGDGGNDVIPVFLRLDWIGVTPDVAPQYCPQDWFTTRLMRFSIPKDKEENAKRGFEGLYAIRNDSDARALAPIRQACANVPSAKNAIMTTLDCQKNDTGYVVSFIFGGICYKHTYLSNEIVDKNDDISELDFVSVWPNRSCQNWNRYFVYLAGSRTARANLKDCYTASVYNGHDWQSLGDNRQGFTDTDNIGLTVTDVDYVKELQTYPSIISILRGNEEMGLLLLDSKTIIADPTAEAQIGVDFGTSNTIAYLNFNNSIKPIEVKDNRNVLIGDPDDFMLTFGFAPNTETGSTLPHRTVVRTFPNLDRNKLAAAFISVVAPMQYCNDLREEYRQGLDDNLKWPRPGMLPQSDKTQAFLEYLMLMWLWQILADHSIIRVACVFTYPNSLETQYQNSFKGTVIPAVIRSMPNGITFNPNAGSFATESEAVGPFINANEIQNIVAHNYPGMVVNNEVGYLLMDIGGGTVDVSVWQLMTDQHQNRKLGLCFQTSMKRFAGNYMQVEQVWSDLCRRDSLLLELLNTTRERVIEYRTMPEDMNSQQIKWLYDAICPNNQASSLDEFRRNWTASINLIVNAINTGKGVETLQKRKAYLMQIEMYFYYLFFMCGCMVGEAFTAELMTYKGDAPFSVLLAGNGSLMYDLVDTDKETFRIRNLRMLNWGIACGGSEDKQYQRCNLIPSPRHKHEVAYGASNFKGIVGINPIGGTVDFNQGGDILLGNEHEHQWNQAVTVEQLRHTGEKYIAEFIDHIASERIWGRGDAFRQLFGCTSEQMKSRRHDHIESMSGVLVGINDEAIDTIPKLMVAEFKAMMNDVVQLNE